ncbi:VOC family protein [Myroides sp. DF42-4-2]|uniref:VOC family protein n=1 Tax=unclassified Myroides TaxID=2642485 RepID=UPI0025750AA0|nr:VOC family protein [Myroides sp. DF42-4-2]MDM1408764.1 glyoxalase [Myroides sp. DF42-4-2]
MTTSALNLTTFEVKNFIPCKDFKISVDFYTQLGFDILWQDGQLCLLALGQTKIFLQNFYEKDLADNYMLHLHVANADDWYQHLNQLDLQSQFDITLTSPEDCQWNMREFVLIDPSGVLWRIGHSL